MSAQGKRFSVVRVKGLGQQLTGNTLQYVKTILGIKGKIPNQSTKTTVKKR